LAGDLVPLALYHRVDAADELEEGAAGGREELRAAASADEEADVGLVLERLPAQGKT
jgi:hypothetical protein